MSDCRYYVCPDRLCLHLTWFGLSEEKICPDCGMKMIPWNCDEQKLLTRRKEAMRELEKRRERRILEIKREVKP